MSTGDLMYNRYKVIRTLGRGGEAEVFLVKDKNEQDME
jgi:serine/threonine protein kinase